jgi:ABC-2 type transport system permease protein
MVSSMADTWLRLISMIRKEFIQIFRDPRTLVIIILIPIIQLFLLGLAATTDVKNVELAVWDQNRTTQSRALLDVFRAANYFRVAYDVTSQADLQTLIERGQVRAALIIPPDYDSKLASGDAHVSIILDGSDPAVGSTAFSAARLIGQAYATQVEQDEMTLYSRPAAIQPPLQLHTQVWYNPDLRSAFYMIPGVIGIILFTITSILTATTIVREREHGTIEQLIVTPIRSWELVTGKILPYVILAFFDTLEIIVLGNLFFDMPVRGDLTLVIILSGLLLLSGLGIGLLASTVANTQQEAMLMVYTLLLPSVFLSGFLFPIEAMPRVLQWFSYAMPLRYYLVIIRALLVKGVGVSALWAQIYPLMIFGLAIMGAAAMRFRKRLD